MYELFEGLLKDLVLHRPDQPLDYLIQRLQKPKSRRVFMTGPPGASRKENDLALYDYFGWSCISVGDLLKKEVSKKSEHAAVIQEAFKLYRFVPDSIVIDLVKTQITAAGEGQSFILEGFPRTQVQALSLQHLGVVPDKVILMEVQAAATAARVKANLLANNSPLYGPELDEVSEQAVEEYRLHIKGVHAAFPGFVYEYQADEKDQNEVANDLARMLRIRYKSDAPRRPPRVILLGPPGSGRSTQARIISKRFGLVHICTRILIKAEIVKKPDLAQVIAKCLKEGTLVPESLVIPLIEQRLKQSDCRVNGWVLDGFPQSEAQINLLKSLRIRPSLVCLFEQPEQESLRRLQHRKIDPDTGVIYDMDMSPPAEEAVSARLIPLPEDNEGVIKQRLQNYLAQQHHVEEAYKDMLFTVQADQPIEQVTEVISDVILNPIF